MQFKKKIKNSNSALNAAHICLLYQKQVYMCAFTSTSPIFQV